MNNLGKNRFAQVLEMSNHQLCKEQNQRALLEAKMNQLHLLVHEIQETDWMFEKQSNDNGGYYGSGSSDNTYYNGRPVGFHRGLQERW